MLRRSRIVVAAIAVSVAVGLAAPSSAAPVAPARASVVPASLTAPAAASARPSAYQYLNAHYGSLDKNWNNFSIATRLLGDLKKVGADNYTAVAFNPAAHATFFVPTDAALRTLLKQITGRDHTTEKAVLAKYESMVSSDVDAMLGYGIVRARTMPASAVLASSGRNLLTVWRPRTIHVAVYKFRSGTVISLWDKDQRLRNPRVVLAATNLNAGTWQIIHGIDRVALGFRNHIDATWFDPNQYGLGAEAACNSPVPCAGGTPGHGG
jgi:hypothetical protein